MQFMRWLILTLALAALAALTVYGLRRPDAPSPSIRSVRSAPNTWAGRDVVFEALRVSEVLPGGAFAVGSGKARTVFRGAPEVSVGEDLTVRAAYDPASGEFQLKAARSLPRGMTVFRGVILAVSVVVLLAVAANVHRRFRWEGGFTWRTS
jgi:hypothetical protein